MQRTACKPLAKLDVLAGYSTLYRACSARLLLHAVLLVAIPEIPNRVAAVQSPPPPSPPPPPPNNGYNGFQEQV